MARRIYKYPVPLNSSEFAIEMPNHAIPVRIGWQNSQLFMWAIVDTDFEMKKRYFRLFGTGQDIPDGYGYKETWEHGPLIIHCFEKIP